MKSTFAKLIALFVTLSLVLGGCAPAQSQGLSASGILSAVDAAIAPELSGKVASVDVEEGQSVKAGQTLFKLDDAYYSAQRDQAQAAVKVAEAALATARLQATNAQAQYTLALDGARAQARPARTSAWSTDTPEDFRPGWYYQQDEQIRAAKDAVTAAEAALATAQSDLASELKKASTQDFVAVEVRLAKAQAAYEAAKQTRDQADKAKTDSLKSAAQEKLDAADAELKAARLDYKQMLSTSAADAVVKARARVAVAQAALDNARDKLLALQTGDQSTQVSAAKTAADAAASGVTQAEAGLEQARKALALADLQLKRTTVVAPQEGVVLTRNLEVGEMAAAGGTVMRVARLDTLELIVYLPEDQYGQVKIGDRVSITVDAYAGQTFSGQVIRIADEAEFTPRNVQTEQGRKASVYAVKLRVENADLKLKPGMPADVVFK